MAEREKLIRAMEYCTGDIVPVDENDECLGDVCPFKEGGYESGDCQENMIRAALALIKSLQEDIEVWKKRYRWVAIERKTADDANKEPNIVKVFTTEEMQRREMKRDG